MQPKQRFFTHTVLPLCLAATVVVPLVWIVYVACVTGASGLAWQALWHDPQTIRALCLTVGTALASTTLVYLACARVMQSIVLHQSFAVLQRYTPWMLATPHVAFAIGIVFLVSPSGWILRVVSPVLTGFESPPPWLTTQDPWGIGLTLCLMGKELPFVLWSAWSVLHRDDVLPQLQRRLYTAQTLGYTAEQAFQRVVWPDMARRLRWPFLAVLAYGVTVVDMALVIGPNTPPTLGVLAWQWLQEVDSASQNKGAAAALLLLLLVAVLATGCWAVQQWLLQTSRMTCGSQPQRLAKAVSSSQGRGLISIYTLCAVYVAVLLAIGVGSMSGVWAFPDVWPSSYSLLGWASVWHAQDTLWTTLALGVLSSGLSLLWCMAWLELAPARLDRYVRYASYVPVLMPQVLWAVGVYSMSLNVNMGGSFVGVLWAHCLAVLPYSLMVLGPAYSGFDVRLHHVSASLGHSNLRFLVRIKWPLLRPALAASFAVGFSVSVAQYVATVYVGAGRVNTVTTEALALVSGGQRSVLGAFASLQMVLPLLVFILAAWVSKPKRF